jgi:hypothetical protein
MDVSLNFVCALTNKGAMHKIVKRFFIWPIDILSDLADLKLKINCVN